MISFVYPVYNSQEMLKIHLREWHSYDLSVKKCIKFILIDDCSAVPVSIPKDVEINIEVYRVDKDIPWNVTGARNLGFHVADTEYVFTSDMDALFPKDSAKKLVEFNEADSKTMYWFPRVDRKMQWEKNRHLFTVFMAKKLFWDVGGMDEDFAGQWGYEDLDFLRRYRLDRTLKEGLIQAHVIDYKFAGDASVTSLSRDVTNKILGARKDKGIIAGSTVSLRFPWKKTYEAKL